MDKVATASINNLRIPEADVLPSEDPIFVLTSSQLRQIVADAIQPLQDEVEALRGIVASQIASIKADIKLDSQDIRDIYQHLDSLAITKPPALEPSKKTTSHIDELHRLMLEEKSQQISIAKGARLLGISKERMRQLKPLVLQDGRFEMGWSTIKGKKAAVIRIRRFL